MEHDFKDWTDKNLVRLWDSWSQITPESPEEIASHQESMKILARELNQRGLT